MQGCLGAERERERASEKERERERGRESERETERERERERCLGADERVDEARRVPEVHVLVDQPVHLQKSIPAQIRQLILYISNNKE